MSTLTIRNLESAIIRRLKVLAKANHRSLEGEVRALLEREADRLSAAEWLAEAKRLGEATTPWKPGMPTAAELVREGRDEDR